MKYLTFLDYSTFEAAGKNIEVKLEEKDNEIHLLKKHDQMKDEAMAKLSEQVSTLMAEVKQLKNRKG